jgi:UV DNA damage repair endonuclease
MTIQRVGFACKFNDEPGKANATLNIKSTTVTWLVNAIVQDRYSKLESLVKYNLECLKRQVLWFKSKPRNMRMFRFSSDILPCFTHPVAKEFYNSGTVKALLEAEFLKIGNLVRELDVRVSFHPGQFCVLASDNPQIVLNSIEEFEYHAYMIRLMGFGQKFQDFKCNVHIGGKQGPAGIKLAVKQLSTEARNCLTIENAEFTWQLQHSLELVDTCALVLDVHHHWIATGEHIEPTDVRIQQILESWRGVRPTMHLSTSREEHVLEFHDEDTLPDFDYLTKDLGLTRQKLRAHSDFFWNRALNRHAKTHLAWADIMLESKEKNLAQAKFLA